MDIYNRLKENIGLLRTTGFQTDVLDVETYKRLNSNYELSFLIPMNSTKYPLIEEEGLIDCQGQKYVIKDRKRNREGMGRMVQVDCQHITHRMVDIGMPHESAVTEAFGANMKTFTDLITSATGGVFTFQFMESIPAKDISEWGYGNCLKAFKDLVNTFEVEFVPDNYNIKIYNKINIDNGLQYRFAKNIISNSYETNTDALVTRMTGIAKDSLTIIDLAASHLTTAEYDRLNAISGAIVGGLIKVPYLISQYVSSWATPDNTYFDGDFNDNSIEADDEAGKLKLLEEIRKKLTQHEVPDIQVQTKVADLWKIKDKERQPQIGEIVYYVDSEMEIDNIQARVMEIREYPFDPSKDSDITVANFLLRDENQIIADLNASKEEFEKLMTNGKVNTSAFEEATQQAITNINNSTTELIYPVEGGILAQDPTNELNQVRLTSAGLGISTDGWNTVDAAITSAGIAAPYIVGLLGEFAELRADQVNAVDISANSIVAGSLSGIHMTIGSGDNVFNADASGIYLGNALFASAPFSVDMAGNLVATSATISGDISMTSGSISWASITGPGYSQVTGSKPPTDADHTVSVLALTKGDGTHRGIKYNSSTDEFELDMDKVTTGTLSADKINGGTISGVTIDVTTDISVGEKIIIDPSSFTSGIYWGSGIGVPQIFADPESDRMDLQTSGPIYANGQRIDVQPTAKWG